LRKLEHDLHEQASRRHLSCVVIQKSIDIALVITSQGQKHRPPQKLALLTKVHREKECTQHLKSSNSTLGLAVLEGPRMLVFFDLVMKPPNLILLWVWLALASLAPHQEL